MHWAWPRQREGGRDRRSHRRRRSWPPQAPIACAVDGAPCTPFPVLASTHSRTTRCRCDGQYRRAAPCLVRRCLRWDAVAKGDFPYLFAAAQRARGSPSGGR
jgi:hypothetical protein